MFLGNDVTQIPFAARLRFQENSLGIGIEERHPRSRGPWLKQDVRVFDGGGPGERVSIAMKALDDVHVFAVKVAADLVKPGVGIETPGVHDEGISIPLGNGFSCIRSVQLLQRGMLAAIGGNHAIHRLSGDQAALAGVDKNKIGRGLSDERGITGAGNPQGRQLLEGSSSLAFSSRFFTISQYSGL